MATKGNPGDNRTRSSLFLFIVAGLCGFFYLLGAWQRSGSGKGDSIALEITKQAEDCNIFPNLEFETHHDTKFEVKYLKPCDVKYVDYTPCHDQNMKYKERHCPKEEEKLHCLIPAPKGYVTPFRWPKNLTVEKAADSYIKELSSVIPMDNGTIRTALDIGCGVVSLGAYLFKKNVITMSFAPQVQFALERGVPAIIGVLGTMKLPYPPRAFDMAHCSRFLTQWGSNDGMYMMEVDRVLRPGGYWVLSGPPINWRANNECPQEEEQKKIEEIAERLCWEKIYEKGEIAIWRKCTNNQGNDGAIMCRSSYATDVWYKKMEACVSPYELKPYPKRLNDVVLQEDTRIWKKHINVYKKVNKIIDSGRYRNIMDMNAGLGSFAAALESPKLWVMNVVPTIAEKDTLGVIYERGFIGLYHDWCEAFSTYPRTYDLIHASSLFSLYKGKCKDEDILLEMDRILRLEGAVILRDNVDILMRIKRMVSGMKWNVKMMDHEDGPLHLEKILFAVKQYWVAEENNTTSSGKFA